MLTVAAFLIIALLGVAACETTRARLARLLADQPLRPKRIAGRTSELGRAS